MPQKAQLDPREVLSVKFEDNHTSNFRDMLRKQNVHGRPNAVTSSFSPLRPCVLNSDLKYFNLSIIHLEVIYITTIAILAYFLTKLYAK